MDNNVFCFATHRANVELKKLVGVLSDAQWQSMKEMLSVGGASAEFAASKVAEISNVLRSLPVEDGTEGIRDDALCYLHYQKGSLNFYVAKKYVSEELGEMVLCMRSVDSGRNVDYFHCKLESINNFCEGLELDLYWKPLTIAEARKYA